MKRFAKHLLIATAAAGMLGTTALAWAHGAGRGMDDSPRAERMQKKMAQHQGRLKEALKLTAEQEEAWKAYSASVQPRQKNAARLDRAEWDTLTTPQRMEKMQALRQEREAQMGQRLEAVKKFYAVLTPEQQKLFDQSHTGKGHRMGRHGGEREGGPGSHPGHRHG
jgi:protein CpxP